MPTLEDTVDFKVATLNDLLDADVRTGVAVAADDKYKRWAFLATGAAVMLAIGLVVALVTGGGDDGGGGTKVSGKAIAPPPDTTPIGNFSLGTDPGTIVLGSPVTILNGDGQAVGGGTVIKITTAKGFNKTVAYTATVAVRNADLNAVNTAVAKSPRGIKLLPGLPQPTTTATTAPAAVPILPATTPTS